MVSRPSRPTARKAISTTATGPRRSASESFPRSSAAMVRAVARIQKIIQVTNATATSDIVPPKISCCSKDIWVLV